LADATVLSAHADGKVPVDEAWQEELYAFKRVELMWDALTCTRTFLCSVAMRPRGKQ